jgi:hypothetical protein
VCENKYFLSLDETYLGFLEASESHLCLGNELLGVFQIDEQIVLSPDNSSIFVGRGIRITINRPTLATNNTIKIWASLVWTTLRKKKEKKH